MVCTLMVSVQLQTLIGKLRLVPTFKLRAQVLSQIQAGESRRDIQSIGVLTSR